MAIRRVCFKNEAEASAAMERTGVDPHGIAIMAPKFGFYTFIADGLVSPACNVLKQEALSCGAEAAVARGTVNLSVEKSSVILAGTKAQLSRLAGKIEGQPFGLSAFSNELAQALSPAVPPPIEWRGFRLDFAARPLLMGVLNVTPDSFSDGGEFFDPKKACDRALEMVLEGADIIDVGGESSRPGASPVTAAEEAKRVVPVIKALAGVLKVPVSVDTYRASTAKAALDAGAAMINDISGLRMDPSLAVVAAKEKVPLSLMHMRGAPATMQTGEIVYNDLVGEIIASLSGSMSQAVEAGVQRDVLIIDPGLGFGKTVAHNYEIMRRIGEFSSLGRPVLAGPSRKSFIGAVTGRDAGGRVFGTAAAVAACVMGGANIIRAHDVAAVKDSILVAIAIKES